MEQKVQNAFTQQRGKYFDKKSYQDEPLIPFNKARSMLPEPFGGKYADEINAYWKTWELAYKNVYKPTEESGFVSNFVDAAFNDSIFMWDTVFITMFCNIGHPYIPGIRSLDNFYSKQFDDGEIPREMVRETGKDFDRWVNHDLKPLHSFFHNHYQHRAIFDLESPDYDEMYKPDLGREVERPPYLTLDNLNHPIMAWAEMESYRQTGDVGRLEMVWQPLLMYYEALYYHLRNDRGLFVTDWASMDNSPRNDYLGSGVDISCEMVLFANNLVEIATILKSKFSSEGKTDQARKLESRIRKLEEDASTLSKTINEEMWDPVSGFYYDLTDSGERAPVKTVAAFWALLAGVANENQAEKLASWLKDDDSFSRVHRVPTLAADEKGYNPDGGYWRGSSWAPTNTMVIRGLEKYGYTELAREIAINHLDHVVQVYKETGTLWENYAPDSVSPGNSARKDFVGWSGVAPILYFIEHAIGLRGDAEKQELHWKVETTDGEIGCEKYWFAGRTVNLRAQPLSDGSVQVEAGSDGPLNLNVESGNRKKNIHLDGKETFVL
jgi:glycogen debranching enzyme